MARLSRVQSITRQRIVDLARSGLSPKQFSERMCAELRRAIPCDGFRLFGFDQATHLINRTLAASTGDDLARNEWLREIYLVDSAISYRNYPALTSAEIPVAAVHEQQSMSWGIPPALIEQVSPRDHREYFYQSQTPVGGIIFACFIAHDRWIAALQLYRRERNRPFRPTDVVFLKLMAPAIGDALDAAFTRERVQSESYNAADASGFLLLDHGGKLRFSTPSGKVLSALLREAEYSNGDLLPTAVKVSSARLRAGKPTLLLAPTPKGLIRVEAAPGDEDGSIGVVLVPIRRPTLPEVPQTWGLTIQEEQVITFLIQGLSNAAIAHQLACSERTIESHLEHIYGKLDVHRRSQVIARFFQQVFLPGAATEP